MDKELVKEGNPYGTFEFDSEENIYIYTSVLPELEGPYIKVWSSDMEFLDAKKS